MARRCDVCGKGKTSGNTVSHAVNHNKRQFRPNIQKVRVKEDGRTRRINVCTRCLRSGKVTKAV
ncbi:MAG: 50S ribosomal protein L28 [Bacillota bacterium]